MIIKNMDKIEKENIRTQELLHMGFVFELPGRRFTRRDGHPRQISWEEVQLLKDEPWEKFLNSLREE